MRIIALTGGIGSGKSTAAKMFAQLAVPILDLDAVGRELLTDPFIKQALLREFGEGIESDTGQINRQALAQKAFVDHDSTQCLNAIIHPAIYAKEQQWLAKQDAPYVLIEASVLLESGDYQRMDAVIVVLTDQSIRCQRVLARGSQNKTLFNAIVQRQCDDALRQEVADYVLYNNQSLESLQQQVINLHKKLFS